MVSLGAFRVQPLGTVLGGLVPVQIREYRPSITFFVCALTLVGALLLGGGTRGGFLSDAILELIAVPALLIALASLGDRQIWRTKTRPDVYRVLALCCAIALLPLIQLVPLPPRIWVNLLRREELAKVFELVGNETPWMPISVSPPATWLSFLSLLPPLAIFLATMQLSYRERRGLSLVIIAVGVVSVFLGLSQVAQGQSSLLRFFSITNATDAVGFFANRNHFAALLYAVLLFTAVWAIDIGFKIGSWNDLKNFETGKVVALTAILMIFIVVIAGEAMTRSRAGLALTIVALLAVFALTLTDRRNISGATSADGRKVSGAMVKKLLLGATILALILSMQFALYRILGRFTNDPLEDARIVFAHNTVAAAKAFLPFGSGSGTFVPVYQMFERPNDAIANTFANHAHNDFLELWLETGIFGPILLCLFVIWLGFKSVQLWRRPPAGLSAFDCSLARAATAVIWLLLAHSFVDYPLRTEAILAVFAVCCAFLIAPLRGATAPGRDLVRRQEAVTVASSSASASPAVVMRETEAVLMRETEKKATAHGRRWGEGIDWPDQWRNSDTNNASKTSG